MIARADLCRRAVLALFCASLAAIPFGCNQDQAVVEQIAASELTVESKPVVSEPASEPSAQPVSDHSPLANVDMNATCQAISMDSTDAPTLPSTVAVQTPQPLMLDDNPSNGQEGPVVVNSRKPTSWFDIDMPGGSLDFRYQFEHDTTKQAGTTTSTTNHNFEESLSLLTDADIVSPNLVDLRLGALVGLQQNIFDAGDTHEYSTGVLYGWDVNATILRNEDSPLTLYTHRTEQTITPDFSPTLQSTDTTYGGNLLVKSNWAPTELEIYHSEDNQNELGTGASNFSMSQDVAHLHTDIISVPHQTLSWNYNYRNTRETESGGGPVRYQTNDLNVNHSYTFGPADVNSLSSSFSGTDETGSLAYQLYRVDETLQLQHSENFKTHYGYSFEDSTFGGLTQISNSADVGLVHQLFKSLTTSADANGSLVSATGNGEIEQYAGRLDFDYHKLIPYGTLLSDLNFGWQWQRSPNGSEPTPVINQPFVFSGSQPLILTQPNIDPNSIMVLSSAGVPYLNGRDFTVNRVANLTQIQRVVGGLIPSDGGVLLDYNLLPEPANTTNTGNASFSTRYEIDKGFLTGLAPYVRYSIQRQSIDASSFSSTLIADSYDDVVVGADYRVWVINFNAEEQWHSSTVVPFDATRFSAGYNNRFDDSTTGSLAASYLLLDYYDEHDHVTDASVSATLARDIARELTARIRAIWLDDEDELFGPTRGLEEQLELEWTHNQTHVYVRVRNATLQTGSQTSGFQVFEFGLTRRF